MRVPSVPFSSPSFPLSSAGTKRVPNAGWHPATYTSGRALMRKGSRSRKEWHHSVSGAVGAMWRHCSVDAASASRAAVGLGGSTASDGCADGRYLNRSSSGWPACARIVRAGVVDGAVAATRTHAGFVSQSTPARERRLREFPYLL